MQTFKSRGDRHEFEVDGIQLWLPGVTFPDLIRASEIAAMGDQGGEEFRRFMTRRVRPWWRRYLVRRLGYRALFELYRAWVGALEGEASGSQPSSTPTSSEPTSETSTVSASTESPDEN